LISLMEQPIDSENTQPAYKTYRIACSFYSIS
jgi:hypothetical protein